MCTLSLLLPHVLAGTVKMELKAVASESAADAAPSENKSPHTLPGVAGVAAVIATPCCLPPSALGALLERGVVGTVARVLN